MPSGAGDALRNSNNSGNGISALSLGEKDCADPSDKAEPFLFFT